MYGRASRAGYKSYPPRLNCFNATGVFCRFKCSFSLPAGLSFGQWAESAPAWQDGQREVDKAGRPAVKFGPFEGAKLTACYCELTGRGYVSGGLQSFYHGHNLGPFPFADAVAAWQALSAALLLPPEALRVHVLETGVTVPTGEAPTAFLAQVARAHYGPTQKPFFAKEPPANYSRPLQYVAVFGQYRVKLYNKIEWQEFSKKPSYSGPTGHGFRFEIHYRKAEKLAAVLGWNGRITVANLMQPAVFMQLANALLQSWQHLHLPPTMNLPANLTFAERALVVSGSQPGFWEDAKRNTPEGTYKENRTKFNKLQKALVGQGCPTPYTPDLEREIAAALP